MDHSLLHQDVFGNYKTRETNFGVSCSSNPTQEHQKKPSPAAVKPQPPELALRCPRCDSTNTKFCYYNNYSLSQPRYFCKSCRRYWTKGGTLRNIPVGGGCRKNKRSTSSTPVSRSLRTTPEPAFHDSKTFSATSFGGYNNNNDQIDLNLAFALLNKQSSNLGFASGAHQSHLEGLFGASQLKENGGYNALGNGGSGVDMGMGDPNKVLWGFPWQMNGENFGHVDQIDSGRDIWSNVNYVNSGALM